MSKVKKFRQSGSGSAVRRAKPNHRHLADVIGGKTKKVKKKKKPIATEVKSNMLEPPRDPEQYSENWKTLLGFLNSQPTSNADQQKEESPKAKKPRTMSDKDSKSADGANKTLNTTIIKRHKDLTKISHRVKTERVKESEAQQNGNGPSGIKKVKDKDREAGREKWNKKTTLEEVEKKPTEADIWFDDVDPDDIEAAVGPEAAEIVRKRSGMKVDGKSAEKKTERALVKERAFDGLTRAVAMDCEMVGAGLDGEESMLARVSIVNRFGKCVYDKYVKPTEPVTDYRTAVSGIRPSDIEHGEEYNTVQQEVAEILQGRILVGHAIHNDLKILFLDHPKKMIRDTQKYKPFKKIAKSGRPALRVLCRDILHVRVQQGEHSSVQDAQATMRLYTMVKKHWEMELKARRQTNKTPNMSRKHKHKTDQRTAPAQTMLAH